MKTAIWGGLLAGFWFLYLSMAESRLPERVLRHTRESLEFAARQRSIRGRNSLRLSAVEYTLWKRMEQYLDYSGIALRHPAITSEGWCTVSLILGALGFTGILFVTRSLAGGVLFVGVLMLGEYLILKGLARRNMRVVDEELLKFLDFLGNYSITAGEVTGIFRQVSRYMEEPLQTVLERCSLEAQTTGDVGMALLSMAEKIEHPKFKELIRNMEVGIRYSADFSALVRSSRRSIREYQQMKEDRRGVQREALLNMLLLLGMSFFVLLSVDKLIDASIWQILFFTLPGRMALLVIGVILALFAGQVGNSR